MPQEFLRDVLRTGDADGPSAALVGPAAVDRDSCDRAHSVSLQSMVERGGSSVGRFSAAGLHWTVTPSPPPPPSPPAPVSAEDTRARQSWRRTEIAAEQPKVVVAGRCRRADLRTARTSHSPVHRSSVRLERCRRRCAAATAGTAAPKLVRVGGVIREPKKLVHVAPIYPDIARISRMKGGSRWKPSSTPPAEWRASGCSARSRSSRTRPFEPCDSGGIRRPSSMACPFLY